MRLQDWEATIQDIVDECGHEQKGMDGNLHGMAYEAEKGTDPLAAATNRRNHPRGQTKAHQSWPMTHLNRLTHARRLCCGVSLDKAW